MPTRAILDSPAISKLVFWPRPERVSNPRIVDCGDAELACYYYECNPNGCTVVFFHGNGETVATYAQYLPEILEIIGCNTFIAEYRGYGASTGVPGLSFLFSDCKFILNRVPASPEKMIFYGRSLGCLQAVEAASLTPTARGLILESGIADLYEYVLWLFAYSNRTGINAGDSPFNDRHIEELRAEISAHYDIRPRLSGFPGPCLVTYSTLDLSERQEASERLFSWHSGRKRLLSFSNGTHNSILTKNIKTYCEQILEMSNGTFHGAL